MTQIRKSDDRIHRDVLSELESDPFVDASDIGVQVKEGVVSLTGKVTTYSARLAAGKAAHRVAGVSDVANDVIVRPAGETARTDGEIATAVRRALLDDVRVPDRGITSTVALGVVTLEGEVGRASQKEAAAQAIAYLPGVIGVANRITVTTPSIDETALRSAILQALERQIDREAKQIDVRSTGGTVHISGCVHSWAERDAIIGTAYRTPGVQVVEDNLRVDSFGRSQQQHHV
jgi:osmotically-inducible protein OsmY